jgi:oligopeptide/dipeptide ABC transporter ATP-binding protein
MSKPVVLEIRGLCVGGPHGRSILDDVEMTLRAGEVTALVGETGSGKTTVLNSVLGLLPTGLEVNAGEIWFESGLRIDLLSLSEPEMRRFLGVQIGYVPQDVRSGLNPLMTARATVIESTRSTGQPARERADAAMRKAGLANDFVRDDADRRPGQLSGGQCQRVLFAQAIVNHPRVLLLDEPTASLDPPTRREVQATIRRLAADDCAICLVTHDLSSLVGLADTVGVMYLGKVVESGPADEVLRHPRHPYTRGLLACVPRLDERRRLVPIPGEPPNTADEVTGCRYHPRCEFCEARCRSEEPMLREIGFTRKAACHVVDIDQP